MLNKLAIYHSESESVHHFASCSRKLDELADAALHIQGSTGQVVFGDSSAMMPPAQEDAALAVPGTSYSVWPIRIEVEESGDCFKQSLHQPVNGRREFAGIVRTLMPA